MKTKQPSAKTISKKDVKALKQGATILANAIYEVTRKPSSMRSAANLSNLLTWLPEFAYALGETAPHDLLAMGIIVGLRGGEDLKSVVAAASGE